MRPNCGFLLCCLVVLILIHHGTTKPAGAREIFYHTLQNALRAPPVESLVPLLKTKGDRSRVSPFVMDELAVDFEDLNPLENGHESDKRRSTDYGHLRFGKREEFGDYGHTRFGRSTDVFDI